LGSWAEDESKRDLLDRLFAKLPNTDKGRLALMRMAKYLMEQKSFPDLKNWEDSEHKIKEAHEAVSRLRLYHKKQEEQIQSEEDKQKAREEFHKKQQEIARSQQSLQKLNSQLNELGQRLGEHPQFLTIIEGSKGKAWLKFL